MSSYSHIFFDLDHTLWDYDTNSKDTLSELYSEYNLDQYFSAFEAFFKAFHFANNKLWELYNQVKVDKAYIRHNRFRMVLENRTDLNQSWIDDLSDSFVDRCCRKQTLVEGAMEMLLELRPHFSLNIISNGFTKTQNTKLESAQIDQLFDYIITSESIGFRKPAREIFDYALETAQIPVDKAVMIGDNLITDVKGSVDAGWTGIWYNPEDKTAEGDNIYQIKNLKELIPLLMKKP